MNHKPNTPLPWDEKTIFAWDIEYLIHAANAYPKLVKFTQECVARADNPFSQDAKELLKEIDEK